MNLHNNEKENFDIATITSNKDANEIREFLENIIALMPGHVFWKDRNGVLLGCNDLQAKAAGLPSRKHIIGKTDYDLPWKDQADALRKVDLQVIETGMPVTVEEISTLSNGKEAIFFSKKVPLYHKGKIIGILGIAFDITAEKKLAERELQEARLKLEGMSLVSSIMAHELRTPLCAFGIATDGAREIFPHLKKAYLWAKENGGPVEDISSDYLDGLEKSLNNMNKEIRGSFEFIDIMLKNSETGVDKGEPTYFPISASIEEALSRYPFVGNKNLVHWQNNPDADFIIYADKLLIIHVLFNLLKNALYYVAAAGKGDIQIWLEKGKEYNKLFFKDTGAGIDSDILPKVFDRFFSRTHHGAGIGLTFCKNVMEALGGAITCDSVKDDYTLFTLSFPSNIEFIKH